jgi:hypothetical protein
LKRPHKRNARILAATAADGPPFIIGFWLERDANPLYTFRIAGLIEPHARYPDPRIISLRNQPRKDVEFTIGTAYGSGIQNPFHFMRITRLGLHDHAETVQLESTHRISS